MTELLLASQSPRRVELLASMGVQFQQQAMDIDESRLGLEAPEEYVERLAKTKAQAGYEWFCRTKTPERLVSLGADTIVVVGAEENEILGKPRGLKDSIAMLRTLSGSKHVVFSGVAVTDGARTESTVVRTEVYFRTMSEDEIVSYAESGEGADKAGSYGIQGIGGIFVERIEGSFSSVMGLPVAETEVLLRKLDVEVCTSHG